MQHRNAFFSLVLLVAGAAPGPAVDPAMINLVMPDAKVIAGMDLERVKNSPFGQYLISQMKLNEPEAQKFMSLAGFDPRRDLREVLLVTSDAKSKADHGVAIIRGVFDETKIAALAASAGVTESAYQGVKIFTPAGKAKQPSLAFLAGNLLLAGEEAGLKSIIDRFRASSKLDPALSARIQAAGGSYDGWVVTTGSPTALAGTVENPNMQSMMNGDLMKGIESLVAGVRFGANVEIGAEATARSERDAQALLDVMNFFVSMAQSNGNKPQGPAQLLQSLRMSADGRVVKVSLQTTEQDFEKMFAPGVRAVRKPLVKPVAIR